MNINYMREFVVLAQDLSYTYAAKKLYLSQPALTRHIATMEEELGVKLLTRTKHSVELTPAGEDAQKVFIEVLRRYDEFTDSLLIDGDRTVDLHLGLVYYGVSIHYGFPLLKAVHQHYPEMHISTISSQSSRVISRLHDGSIDAAVTISSRFFDDAAYGNVVIDNIPMFAVMQLSHPLARRNSFSLEELVKLPLIINRMSNNIRSNVELLLSYHNLIIDHPIYLEHIDMLLLTLEETGGIFIGSKLLASIPQNNLAFIPIDADDFRLDISVRYRIDSENPNIQKLLSCIPDIKLPEL
jgi:DNA-binding transcriptional LysR family regulator